MIMENNETTLGKRIAAIRKTLGLSQKDMAAKLGIMQTSVSNYEIDRTNPDPSTLVKISEIGAVTLDWLLTGNEAHQRPIITDISTVASNARMAEGNWFPVVAMVTAGDYQVFEDNVTGEVFMACKQKGGNFAVIVEGNSMDGGTKPIADGDYVLVDPEQTPLSGDVIVVLSDNRQMVKQLGAISDDEIELISFNKEYPRIPMKKELISKMHRVVYHQPQGKRM